MRRASAIAVVALFALVISASCSASAGTAISTLSSRPQVNWVQASLVLGDGFNAGIGMKLSDRLGMTFNLDLLGAGGSASAAALYRIADPFFVLTGAYCGAGAAWEIYSGKLYPCLTAGGEFGAVFAEYEWVIAPHNYGKVRSGIRVRF